MVMWLGDGSRTVRVVVATVLCASLLVGCAAVFRGPVQTVPVTSAPTGAEVYLNGELVGTTPLEVEVASGSTHELRIRSGTQERVVTLTPGIDDAGSRYLALDVVPGGVVIVGAVLLAAAADCPGISEAFCNAGGIVGAAAGAALIAIPIGIDLATGAASQVTPHEVFVSFD